MDYFAVFGDPISHSKSPIIHNFALQSLKIDGVYGRVLLENGNELKEKFQKLNLKGANITSPHKEFAFEISDIKDKYSKITKSTNTLIKKDNKFYGYNTDLPGFLLSLKDFENIKTALIIGAGKTSQTINQALYSQNIKTTIINRSDKSENFKNFDFFTWKNYEPKAFDIVINATSANLKEFIYPMPIELLEPTLRQSKFGYDVIYNQKTPFLLLCEMLDKPHKNGEDMLINQAALSLNLFYDEKFEVEKIANLMKFSITL